MDALKRKARKWLAAVWLPVKHNFTFFFFMYLLGLSCIMTINGYGKHIAVFELFIDLYAVCLLLYWLPARFMAWVRGCVYALSYLLALVDMFCYLKFGSPISFNLLQVCVQTNPREATEALATYVTLGSFASPLIAVPIIMLLNVLFAVRKVRLPFLEKGYDWCFGLASVAVMAYGIGAWATDKAYCYYNAIAADDSLELQYNVDKPHCAGFYIAVYRLAHAANCLYVADREVRDIEGRVGKTAPQGCSFRSSNIVLIIGEATTRHHLHLYGYPKPTTPRQDSLAATGLLVPFADVVSPHNQTSEVFKTAFSTYSYGMDGSWYEYPLFTELMKNAGYNVTFITNQFVKKPNADIFDFCGGLFLNTDKLSRAQFSHRNTRPHEYDEGLLADYDSLKAYATGRNFVIFHLLGCHTAYDARYPRQFDVFKKADYNRPDLDADGMKNLAAYDNAVLYNDYIVAEIIKRFEDEDAIVIYMPDHGEMAFIGSSTYGRTLNVTTQNEVYQQFDIPFWIYVTPKYREAHGDIYAQMLAAKARPFMTDAIDQVILYLAGVETQYYDSRKNILSPDFDASRKRLIMGGIDYDSFMQGYRP